jgi:hypothetical protein
LNQSPTPFDQRYIEFRVFSADIYNVLLVLKKKHMKKALVIFSFFFAATSIAQDENKNITKVQETPVQEITKEASYPGGQEALMQ